MGGGCLEERDMLRERLGLIPISIGRAYADYGLLSSVPRPASSCYQRRKSDENAPDYHSISRVGLAGSNIAGGLQRHCRTSTHRSRHR